MDCELCKLEKLTKWYYEDKSFVIIDCKTCHVPMVVLRRHGDHPTATELKKIFSVVRRKFPNRKWDFTNRKIHDHWHFHLRP